MSSAVKGNEKEWFALPGRDSWEEPSLVIWIKNGIFKKVLSFIT
jgi:hypothetical protein